MAAIEVGVYTRVAGVWERCNDGTPTGFSGPQTRVAGVWENCVTVETKQSNNWEICWVNIDGEIDIQVLLDFGSDATSPYSSTCQAIFESDGDFGFRSYNNNAAAPGYTYRSDQWRKYDCGRDYQIKWEEDNSSGGVSFSRSPTLAENTWADLSTTYTFTGTLNTGTSFGNGSYGFTVRIREKVSAPSAGNDSASISWNYVNGDL